MGQGFFAVDYSLFHQMIRVQQQPSKGYRSIYTYNCIDLLYRQLFLLKESLLMGQLIYSNQYQVSSMVWFLTSQIKPLRGLFILLTICPTFKTPAQLNLALYNRVTKWDSDSENVDSVSNLHIPCFMA